MFPLFACSIPILYKTPPSSSEPIIISWILLARPTTPINVIPHTHPLNRPHTTLRRSPNPACPSTPSTSHNRTTFVSRPLLHKVILIVSHSVPLAHRSSLHTGSFRSVPISNTLYQPQGVPARGYTPAPMDMASMDPRYNHSSSTNVANGYYTQPSYNVTSQAYTSQVHGRENSSNSSASSSYYPNVPQSPSTTQQQYSPSSPTSPSSERYPCSFCDKTFSRSFDRRRHMATHVPGSSGNNRCPYCSREYSRADSLKRHLDNGCDRRPQQ